MAEADEIVPWVGLRPYWVDRVLEIPHLADYGTHIPATDIDDWVALARRHLTICADARAPFISVAHHHGLSCYGDPEDWRDAGYQAHRRVIEMARQEFGARYVPLSEIADRALVKQHVWLRRDGVSFADG